MKTTKTLNEQVSEIVNSKVTRSTKVRNLKKLGITNYEIHILLDFTGQNTIDQIFTFGVEIETYGMTRSNLYERARVNNLNCEYQGYNHRDSNTIFKFVTDSSIRNNNGMRDDTCIECVTPVLSNNDNGFNALNTCCKTLNEAGAKVNRSTGLHVHIGSETLTAKQYVNTFHNYKMLEAVIDSFMAQSRRGNNSQWCRSLADHDFSTCTSVNDVQSEMSYDRYHKVNAVAYDSHRTIEFRQHQGSTDYEKISMWVKFCAKLVAWSGDNKLTSEVESIDAIPFLSESEKSYFKARKEQLA